ERVSAVLGHDVHQNAGREAFGGDAARLEDDLLGILRVEAVGYRREEGRVEAFAIEVDVGRTSAVDRERRAPLTLCAADILRGGGADSPWEERGIRAAASGGRDRVQRTARDCLLLDDVLRVHHR